MSVLGRKLSIIVNCMIMVSAQMIIMLIDIITMSIDATIVSSAIVVIAIDRMHADLHRNAVNSHNCYAKGTFT